MKPFVDLEGSGRGITTIRSNVDVLGTLRGADDSELRDLSVENTGATRAMAISNTAAGFVASRVSGHASGGSMSSVAIANTVAGGGGRFQDVDALAEGSPNTTGISSSGGLLLRVRTSAFGTSFAFGLFNAGSNGEVTDLTARAVGDSYGAGIRNEAGAPLLRNVRASGSGGSIGEGIVNGGGSAARIRDAVGGTSFASGIRNEFSSASVSDATITLEAKSSAFGVTSSFSGTPALRNVTVLVTAGGNGVGVRSDQTQVSVEGSTISADGFSLENAFGAATTSISVGASRLEGAVQPADGVIRCVASYDQAYAPLGPGCTP